MLRACAIVLALLLFAPSASAFIWPNTAERIERQLSAPDVEQRRAAAQRLRDLPETTGRRLARKALADADLEVRLMAAEAALQFDLPGLGDLLVPWLNDPERRVRLAAAEILRHSPSVRAVPQLGRMLSDPDLEVRSVAADALGAAEHADAVLPLLGHLDDPVPEVRRRIVVALGHLRDARAIVPLIGKVQDAQAEVRRAVAEALGRLGDDRAASALVLALRDNDNAVQIAALQALGRLGDPSTTLPVASLLDESSAVPVRHAALQALAQIGTEEGIQLLVERLGAPEHEEDQEATVRAIHFVGPRAVPHLAQCLAGQPPRARADACIRVLGAIGTAKALPLIVGALSRNAVSAPSGLHALEALGAPSGLRTVLEYLSDQSAETRQAAISAAGELLDPRRPDGRAVEPILAALSAAGIGDVERRSLVALLGETGSRRAAPVLVEWVQNNDDVELRLIAIEALGQLGAVGQDAALLDALDAEQPAVRMTAALALRRSGAAKTASALLTRLERAAEQDRAALTLALQGPLGRTRERAVVERAARLLSGSRGGERDAIIEALSRAKGKLGSQVLLTRTSMGVAAERAKIAEVLALHPEAVATLRKLSRDVDASVRANAVWSLGSVGASSDIPRVAEALKDRDVAVAGNAAAVLGLLAKRHQRSVRKLLCPVLVDQRAYVRANALAGLRLAGERCEAKLLRRLLRKDESDRVRANAALLIKAVSGAEKERALDLRAIERCINEDVNSRVAVACAKEQTPSSDQTELVSVFVVPFGETAPIARASFALARADGLLRLGVADRRGALFEAKAPRGPLALAVPAPLVR